MDSEHAFTFITILCKQILFTFVKTPTKIPCWKKKPFQGWSSLFTLQTISLINFAKNAKNQEMVKIIKIVAAFAIKDGQICPNYKI